MICFYIGFKERIKMMYYFYCSLFLLLLFFFYINFSRRLQHFLDQTVPYTMNRWIAVAVVCFLYILRVWLLNGFFIVTYGLGIFLLNLFIGFITPQVCSFL